MTHAASLRFRHAACAIVVFATAARAQSEPWITFVNQTATRLPTMASFVSDPDEKDLIAIDVDHDGDVDLIDCQKNDIYATVSARTHRLLLNTGGQFIEATSTYAVDFLTHPSIARLGIARDFTGDGWEDLVVVNTNDAGFGSTTQQQLQFYRNLGKNAAGQWLGFVYDTAGRFPQYTSPYARFCGGDALDFDLDGDLDLYLGDYENSLEDRLLQNDGTGVFTDVTTTRIPGGTSSTFTVDVFAADFNGDGAPDLAMADGLAGIAKIRMNDGLGNFPSLYVLPSAATYTMVVGDINGDGLADVYQGRDAQDSYNINTTPLGASTPSFTDVVLTASPGTTHFSGNGVLVDMDNDGDLDLVMGDVAVDPPGCDRHATLLRNDPLQPVMLSDPWAATLNCATGCRLWHTYGTHDVVVLDLDGDGRKDMIYANCVGYACWIQTLPPPLLTVTEPQPGAMLLSVANLKPYAPLYNLASLVQLPPGVPGPFFGLDGTAFTIFTAFYPAEPFAAIASPSGSYSYSFPAGTFPQTLSWTWQMRSVVLDGPSIVLSNIVTTTF